MKLTPETLLHRLKLLPYQSAFAANSSRFKIGLWARQTGKDHTAAAEAVIDVREDSARLLAQSSLGSARVSRALLGVSPSRSCARTDSLISDSIDASETQSAGRRLRHARGVRSPDSTASLRFGRRAQDPGMSLSCFKQIGDAFYLTLQKA